MHIILEAIFMNYNCNHNKRIFGIRNFTLFYLFFLCWFSRVSLQYFTTHMDLVRRQQEAIQQRKAVRKGLQSDKDWTGDGFVKETESMVSN